MKFFKLRKKISVFFIIVVLFLSACEMDALSFAAPQRAVVIPVSGSVGRVVSVNAPFVNIWTTQQVIDVFFAHGLEVGNYYMTNDDYWSGPNKPSVEPVEIMRFITPSLCGTCGGRIMLFENAKDLTIFKNYYLEIGRSNAFLFSWVFQKDNILVQLNGFLERETVRNYENALKSLGG